MSGNLIDILQRLSACHVDFVIVGGFAAVAHGSTMVTQDLDICCDFSAPNLMRLQKAIADIHPVHRLTSKCVPLQLTFMSCKDLKNLYLDTDIGPLDCLSSVLGIGAFEKVRKCSVRIKGRGNRMFRVLSLDALIRAKKAMRRPKDKEAVIQLQAIRNRRS